MFFLFQNKGSEKQKKRKIVTFREQVNSQSHMKSTGTNQNLLCPLLVFFKKKKTFPFSKVGTRTRSHVKRKKKVSLQVGEIAESVIIINSFSALLVEP